MGYRGVVFGLNHPSTSIFQGMDGFEQDRAYVQACLNLRCSPMQ